MHDDDRNKLIADHMEMATAIASECLVKYNLASLLPYDDLVAYARAGLVEAATKYKPSKGTTFRSYSWARIKGAVLDGVRKNSRYSRAYHPADLVQDESTAHHTPTTLAGIQGPDDGLLNGDELPDVTSLQRSPEEAIDAARVRATLLRAVDALPARQRDVIMRYYFRGEDIADVAAHYGFHTHTIVRDHSRSLAQLRQALAESLTPDAQGLPQ